MSHNDICDSGGAAARSSTISSVVRPAQRISAWLEILSVGLAAVTTTTITLIALFNTAYFLHPAPLGTPATSEDMSIRQAVPTLLFFAACFVLVTVLIVISYLWIKLLPSRRIGPFLFCYSASACLIWVLAINATGNQYGYPDSDSLITAANSLVLAKNAAFAPPTIIPGSFLHTYFSWYPFQTGALLWFALVFFIFGEGNLIAFLVINAFLVSASIWALWKIGTQLGLNETGQRIAALLLMLDVPLITSSGFIYTNAVGFCMALFAVLASVNAIQQNTMSKMAIWMCVSFAIGALAMLVKGTEVLFVLAITIIFVLSSLRKRLYWLIVLDAALFIVAHWISGLSLPLVEYMTGQRFGPGLPQLSWIAIGLTQDSRPGASPGWWNGSALGIFQLTGGDKTLQQQFADNTVSGALGGFYLDPQYAISFFTHKLASEWAEPTYQGFYYSSFSQRRGNSPLFNAVITGTTNHRLVAFENVYQSVLYGSAAAGFIVQLFTRKRDGNAFEAQCLVGLTILAGFGCFVFWEAKSVYILPFATMMILPGAFGLQLLASALQRLNGMLIRQRPPAMSKSMSDK